MAVYSKLLTEPFDKSSSHGASQQEQIGKFGQYQINEYFFVLIKIPNETGARQSSSVMKGLIVGCLDGAELPVD